MRRADPGLTELVGHDGQTQDVDGRVGDLWESGDLAGKPGAAFTGGWSASGGIEATLLQLFHLLASHGLLFVGLPWSDRMRRSGSFYGATAHGQVTDDDRAQAHALGRRVARLTVRLAASEVP